MTYIKHLILFCILFFCYTGFCAGEWILFDSPECPHCAELLEKFDKELSRNVRIHDIGEPENYQLFIKEAEIRGYSNAWPGEMPILMTEQHILQGQEEILHYIHGGKTDSTEKPHTHSLMKKMYSYIYLRMFIVGLIDGINPCAFALMIFVCAALRLAGRRHKALLVAALAFVLAVASTYLAMGWGLLHGLRACMTTPFVRGTVYILFALVTAVAAVFSLIAIFKKKLVVSVPERWRRWLQRSIRRHVHFGTGLAVIAGMGVVAAGVESVCTGQVYLPALLMVEREKGRSLSAFFSLLIYNIGFILPLCAVAFGAVAGLKAAQLEKWGTKQMRWASGVLTLLFIVFTAYLAISGVKELQRDSDDTAPLVRISDTHIFDISRSNAVEFVEISFGAVSETPVVCSTDDNEWYWLFTETGITVDFWVPTFITAPIDAVQPVTGVREATVLPSVYTDILSNKKLQKGYSEFVGAVAWWILWQQKYGDSMYANIPTNSLYELIYNACESCGEATSFRLVTSRYGFSSEVTTRTIDTVKEEELPVVVTWHNGEAHHAAVVVQKGENNRWTAIRFLPGSVPISIEQSIPVAAKIWILSHDM